MGRILTGRDEDLDSALQACRYDLQPGFAPQVSVFPQVVCADIARKQRHRTTQAGNCMERCVPRPVSGWCAVQRAQCSNLPLLTIVWHQDGHEQEAVLTDDCEHGRMKLLQLAQVQACKRRRQGVRVVQCQLGAARLPDQGLLVGA